MGLEASVSGNPGFQFPRGRLFVSACPQTWVGKVARSDNNPVRSRFGGGRPTQAPANPADAFGAASHAAGTKGHRKLI
jgi:hypothetical protein